MHFKKSRARINVRAQLHFLQCLFGWKNFYMSCSKLADMPEPGTGHTGILGLPTRPASILPVS